MPPTPLPDIQTLRIVLTKIEAIAEKGSDAGRVLLADMLEDFRPRLSAAALHADGRAFDDAVNGLGLMLRRYVMMTVL